MDCSQEPLTIPHRQQTVLVSSPQYQTTPFQRWYYQRNIQRVYSVFVVGAKFNLSTPTPLPSSTFKSWVTKSLSDLIYAYLTLALNVYEEGQIVAFLDKMDVDDVVTYHTIPIPSDSSQNVPNTTFPDASITSLLHTIQETPLLCYGSSTLPMWRLHVVNQEWFFFAFDHLLFDGSSGKNMQTNFYAALNANLHILTQNIDHQNVDHNEMDNPNGHHTNKMADKKANELFSRQALITRLSSQQQEPPTRLVPFPMEYHINTAPSWLFLGQVIGGETVPTFIQKWCSTVAQRMGLIPTPDQFAHEPESDDWYVLKVREEEDLQDVTTPTTATPTPTTSPKPKYITPLTCIPGKYDCHLQIIRITEEQLRNVKQKFLKPYDVRFSPFLSYLASLSLLPLTLGSSTGIAIPTDARSHAQKTTTNSSLYRSIDGAMTDLLELNTEFDFGCYIGSFHTKMKSLLKYLPLLSHWGETPPESVTTGLDEIRQIMESNRDNKSDEASSSRNLIHLPFLQSLSNSFNSTLNQPDSSVNGLFNGMGLVQIADKLIGLDKVVKKNTQVPERDSTLEISNLGLVKFDGNTTKFARDPSINQSKKQLPITMQVNDLLFTQPATRGCYFSFNVVGLSSLDSPQQQEGTASVQSVNPGGVNIILSASSFYKKEDVIAISDWITYALDNLDLL